MCVCVRERERESVCVCVCERERERERERESCLPAHMNSDVEIEGLGRDVKRDLITVQRD